MRDLLRRYPRTIAFALVGITLVVYLLYTADTRTIVIVLGGLAVSACITWRAELATALRRLRDRESRAR